MKTNQRKGSLAEVAPARCWHSRQEHLAFTLIELLVVIAVIAILAGLLLPALLDEHADSINNGQFFMGPEGDYVVDLPASYHNGSGCFSFADGHSEIHRWRSRSFLNRPVQFAWHGYPVPPDDLVDIRWVQERHGERRFP